MNDLIERIGNDLFTTSLVVADGTGNEHRAVLQLIRNHIEKFQRFGRVAFEMRPFATAGGIQTREIALLNEHQATLLITFMRNSEIVTEFKVALVDAFFRMAEVLKRPPIDLRDPAQLLTLLGDYARDKQQLQQQVAALEPKALFHDEVTAAVNDQPIASIAKVLGTGEIRLFRWLRDSNILMGNNLPYQQFIDAGYFHVVERTWRDQNGEPRVTAKTMVTGKGLVFLQRRWGQKRARAA